MNTINVFFPEYIDFVDFIFKMPYFYKTQSSSKMIGIFTLNDKNYFLIIEAVVRRCSSK